MDPLAADFAQWSPYNYVLGNPISLVDPDGRAPEQPDVQRDKDGNIVFIPKYDATFDHPSGGETTGIGGYIFADDGTPIEAMKNTGDDAGWDTNCHGTCFADGELNITNSEAEKLIEHDNYTQITDLKDVEVGDVAIYPKLVQMLCAFYFG